MVVDLMSRPSRAITVSVPLHSRCDLSPVTQLYCLRDRLADDWRLPHFQAPISSPLIPRRHESRSSPALLFLTLFCQKTDGALLAPLLAANAALFGRFPKKLRSSLPFDFSPCMTSSEDPRRLRSPGVALSRLKQGARAADLISAGYDRFLPSPRASDLAGAEKLTRHFPL